MGSSRTTAIISGIAVVLLGAKIAFQSEGISPLLATLQWLFFAAAVVGLVGSILQMRRK